MFLLLMELFKLLLFSYCNLLLLVVPISTRFFFTIISLFIIDILLRSEDNTSLFTGYFTGDDCYNTGFIRTTLS